MSHARALAALTAHQMRCSQSRRLADVGRYVAENERNQARAERFALTVRDRYGIAVAFDLLRQANRAVARAERAQAARRKRAERKACQQPGVFC